MTSNFPILPTKNNSTKCCLFVIAFCIQRQKSLSTLQATNTKELCSIFVWLWLMAIIIGCVGKGLSFKQERQQTQNNKSFVAVVFFLFFGIIIRIGCSLFCIVFQRCPRNKCALVLMKMKSVVGVLFLDLKSMAAILIYIVKL